MWPRLIHRANVLRLQMYTTTLVLFLSSLSCKNQEHWRLLGHIDLDNTCGRQVASASQPCGQRSSSVPVMCSTCMSMNVHTFLCEGLNHYVLGVF